MTKEQTTKWLKKKYPPAAQVIADLKKEKSKAILALMLSYERG